MVKISTCPKCKGIVRAAIPESLQEDKYANREFMKEVSKHDLGIATITMPQYRKKNWCSCFFPTLPEDPKPKPHNFGGFETIPSKANNVNLDAD